MLQTVARTRLVDDIASQTAPIVTVVAAAGAGKTILLRQLAEAPGAGSAPTVLVSCTEEDRAGDRFVAKIHRSINRPLPAGQLAGSLVEHFGGRLKLLFDDVHHLGDSGESLGVLSELLVAGPSLGRITLAGRRRIPNLARLRAEGAVHEVDGRRLRFSPAECLAATGRRTDRFDGWPALVTIDAAAGPDAVREYLIEQVIGPLPKPDRELLMAAAILGSGDPGVLSEALGRPVTPNDCEGLALLPLVGIGDGQLTVHPMYTESASTVFDSQQRRRLTTGAAKRFMIDDPERWARLLLDSSDGAVVSHGADLWSRLGYFDIPRQVLVGLAGASSSIADGRTDPDVALLRGLLRRTADPMAEEAVELLGQAAAGFVEQGRWADAILARTEEGFAHRIGGRRREMMTALEGAVALGGRLSGSEAGDTRARVGMANAVLADEAGDDAEAVRHIELLAERLLPHRYGGSAYFLGMFCSLQIGDGPRAVGFARHFAEAAPDDRRWAWHLPSVAAWHSGMPLAADRRLPGPAHYQAGNPVDRIWAASSLGLLAALRGDLPAATEALSAAREACPGRTLARVRSLIASTEATVAAAVGRDDEARQAVVDCLDRLRSSGELQPEDGRGVVRNIHWCLAVAYVVAPELRAIIDGLPLAPPLATKRRAGQAVVALRNGDRIEIEGETAQDLRAVIAAIPVRWAAALAAGLHGQRSPAAGRFTDAVVEVYGTAARAVWWSLTDPQSKKLAKTVPIDPGSSVEIKMLGPLRLVVDGVDSTGEHWSRDRVRALLALLAHHGSMRRDEVMLALWPDLDQDGGRRNLRVTLSHLRSLLEPRRNTGEASFYVRTEDDRIWLVDHRSVTTDVARFEQLLDRAGELEYGGPEADGDLTEAVELYQEAISLWHGDYLCQYGYEDWPLITATRLRARYVDACLSVGRHLALLDRLQEAIRMAELALGAEPWSEAAYLLVIDTQLRGGNRAGAIRTLSAYRSMIEDLGVGPAASITDMTARLGLVDTKV